jgi:serine/threonine-protein kinase
MIDRLNAALEGRYRIERELGAGGMATVYLAEDIKHHRKVAVKVLRPELAAVVGAERFLAEIRTTANLEDPHILPLYDSGEADSFLFFVMPYVAGDTLRDRLDRESQLPVAEAVDIARKIGSALAFAHGKGVVHRDIKPANILMRRGEPLVADFGIALALSEAGDGRITETGLSLGTPHYMSPEQASGERMLDVRSDVYALACVLYEMLAGEPPHPGPTAQSVLAKILTDEPRRIMDLRRSVPPHVDAALARGLEKLPADRFETVEAFLKALDDPSYRYGGSTPVGSTPQTDRRRPVGRAGARGPGRWVTLAVIVVLAGAAAWGWLRPTGGEPPLTRVRMALPDSQAAVTRIGPGEDISPDGRRLVYVGAGPNGPMLWLRDLDKLDARPLRGTEGAYTPVFSPDGQSVAYVTGIPGDLKVVGLEGEAPVTLVRDSAYAYGMSWADDGWIYLADDVKIDRIRAQGGAVEASVTPQEGRGETWVGWPCVLPGGRYVLYTAWFGSVTNARVGIRDLETGRDTLLATGLYPRWAGTGHVVYVRADGTVMAAPLDLGSLAFAAEPAAIFGGVSLNAAQAYAELAISRTGTLLYRTGAATQEMMEWVARDGSRTPMDTIFLGDFSGIRISPDGRSVVAAVARDDERNIFVRQLSGGPWRRVSFETGDKQRPDWVPGRNAVSYLADESQLGDSALDARVASAVGSGSAETVLDLSMSVQEATWSPDGEWLVYRVGPGAQTQQRDIYAINGRGTGDTIPLANSRFDEHSPAVSPDGRWLAYVSSESGRPEVFVRPFPDIDQGKWVVSADGGNEPAWSPAGGELFYRSGNNVLIAAQYVDDPVFAVVGRTPLFSTDEFSSDPVHTDYAVDSRGQRFLVARVADEGGTFVLVQNWFQELLSRAGGDR